jgi:hypothetical protein
VNVIKTVREFCALAIMLGLSAFAHGQVIPIDDFNHMNPMLPGWSLVDLSAMQPWGPGIYDPSSGALRIYHSGGLVPPGEPFSKTAMFAVWDDSTDPLFQNGYLRSKMRNDTVNSNTALEMRLDLSTGTGYVLFAFTSPPNSMPDLDGTFLMSKVVNGVETNIWDSGIEYLPGEDWNVELGAIGSRITAKVWQVGDLEPTTPQFDWIDPDPITGGQIAISADKALGNTVPARADGTFDDVVFIVPEPASVALVLAGLVGVLALRRR